VDETTQLMAETIDRKRAELSGNLAALEQKVRAATDWKQHYRRHPVAFLGTALAGGAVLASIVSSRRNGVSEAHSLQAIASTRETTGRTVQTWDNVKSALVALAVTRFTDYVGTLVPGFRDQFQEAQNANKSK
jgi:hypothetical protein